MGSQGCIYLYTVVSFGGILLNTWRNIPAYLKYFVTHGKIFLSNRYISEYEEYSDYIPVCLAGYFSEQSCIFLSSLYLCNSVFHFTDNFEL